MKVFITYGVYQNAGDWFQWMLGEKRWIFRLGQLCCSIKFKV